MKIKKGFILRTIMGQHVIVAEGPENHNFNKIISLNPSATMLWQSVEGKEFTAQDLADKLTAHYDVDAAQALADATKLASEWLENGLLEE